jgi:hypothetical protein
MSFSNFSDSKKPDHNYEGISEYELIDEEIRDYIKELYDNKMLFMNKYGLFCVFYKNENGELEKKYHPDYFLHNHINDNFKNLERNYEKYKFYTEEWKNMTDFCNLIHNYVRLYKITDEL